MTETTAPTDHRILIVDDEEPNVRLLERLLYGAGFPHVHGTTDAREAIPLVREWQPDIVLLDLLMPHVSGHQILEGLHQVVPAEDFLPVLVLTADVTEAAKRKALAAGASDFLTKPFDAVEAVLRIRNLLHTRDLHLQVRLHAEHLEQLVEERTAELSDALRDLRASQDTRRLLLARLVAAQEDEQRRIAYNIHDDPVQAMVAAVLRLQMLRDKLEGTEEAAELATTEAIVHQAMDRLRRMLFELHPSALDSGGLAEALSEYLERTPPDTGWTWRVERRITEEPELGVRTLLYRIAQEALANVAKHARATSVTVEVEEADHGFRLTVRDDGRGFDPERPPSLTSHHLGLKAMRERAELAGGWWRVDTAPGKGTTVECWVPATATSGGGLVAPAEGSAPGAG